MNETRQKSVLSADIRWAEWAELVALSCGARTRQRCRQSVLQCPCENSPPPPNLALWKCLNLPSTASLEHLCMYLLAEGMHQPDTKESVLISVHHSKPELLQQWCSPWSELSGQKDHIKGNQDGGWGQETQQKIRPQAGRARIRKVN